MKGYFMKQCSQCGIGLFVLFVLMPFHTTCCFNWCKKKQNKITPTIVIYQSPAFDEINQELTTLDDQIKEWTDNTFEGKPNDIDLTQTNNNVATVLDQFNLIKNTIDINNPLSIEITLKINVVQQKLTLAQQLQKRSTSQQNISKMPTID